MTPSDPSPPVRDPEFLTGQALIAMPGIGDPRFERAVILICAHDSGHAMGLVVNRPIDGLTSPDLLERLGVTGSAEAPDEPVLIGGPVERERGFVLHTDDYLNQDTSARVGEGIALTATRDVLEAMADPARRPRKAVLALGYSGWGAGQLEQEIRDNVWLTCEPDEALVFSHDHDHKWSQALARLGISAEQLSGQAGRA